MTFACKWKPLSGNFVVRFFKCNTCIYGWSRVKNFFSVQGNKKRKTQTNIQILFIFDVILEMLNLIDVDIFSLTLQNKLWSFSVWDFTGSKFHPIREVKKSRFFFVDSWTGPSFSFSYWLQNYWNIYWLTWYCCCFVSNRSIYRSSLILKRFKWCYIKQLFTKWSYIVVEIYLAALRLGRNPPLSPTLSKIIVTKYITHEPKE